MAPFRDRVLHHALMRICGPYFAARASAASHVCWPGKGVHSALRRAQRLAPRNGYLKRDVSRYFDSINHKILIQLLSRIFKDPGLLACFYQILDSYQLPGAAGKGLPIGNLRSQYFAAYLQIP